MARKRRDKRMWPSCCRYSDVHMQLKVLSDAVFRASMLHDRPFPSAAELRRKPPTIVMFNGCVGQYDGGGIWTFLAKGTLMYGLRDLKRAILTGVCIEEEVRHPACMPLPEDQRHLARMMQAPPFQGSLDVPLAWFVEYLQADSVSKRQGKEVLDRIERRAPVENKSFDTWLSRVCGEMGVDDVDGRSFRSYFDEGLSPADAVLADRMAAGVMIN